MNNTIYLFSEDLDRAYIDTSKALAVFDNCDIESTTSKATLNKGSILKSGDIKYLAFKSEDGSWNIGNNIKFEDNESITFSVERVA